MHVEDMSLDQLVLEVARRGLPPATAKTPKGRIAQMRKAIEDDALEELKKSVEDSTAEKLVEDVNLVEDFLTEPKGRKFVEDLAAAREKADREWVNPFKLAADALLCPECKSAGAVIEDSGSEDPEVKIREKASCACGWSGVRGDMPQDWDAVSRIVDENRKKAAEDSPVSGMYTLDVFDDPDWDAIADDVKARRSRDELKREPKVLVDQWPRESADLPEVIEDA